MKTNKKKKAHEKMLWELFQEIAKPEMCFADCASDHQRDIIKAMDAAYVKGFNDSMS